MVAAGGQAGRSPPRNNADVRGEQRNLVATPNPADKQGNSAFIRDNLSDKHKKGPHHFLGAPLCTAAVLVLWGCS